MGSKRPLTNRIRGWIPKEPALPSNQTITLFNRLNRFQFVRLAYGVMLGAFLIAPLGVYHSISEPYITGYLWGYNLPIGYVGLLLGILVVLYPQVTSLRNLKFSLLMPLIGLALLLTVLFSPNYYFINLQNGTSFSSGQIDIDFQLGNSATVWFSLLSISLGLTSILYGRNKRALNRKEP
jgi:hypothetical protein